MPIKLIAPRAGKTPYYAGRGKYLGVYVDRSTKARSAALARKIIRGWEQDIERGAIARPGEPTFAAAALSYMRAGGSRRFLTPLIKHFGNTALTAIDQMAIDNASASLYPAVTPATINRQVHTPISAILKRAGVEKPVKRPKGWRGRKLTYWLTPDKVFSIFRASSRIRASKDIRLQFRIFLVLICYTGMRRSEPLRLHCRDIDLVNGSALLMDSKTGKPRLVHLPPVVVDEMRLLPGGLNRDAPLFDLSVTRLRTLLRMTLRKAGVTLPRRVGFHVFCHTWATWMRQHAGLSPEDLVRTDRWSTADSADRYAHVVVSEQAKKADLLPVDHERKRA